MRMRKIATFLSNYVTHLIMLINGQFVDYGLMSLYLIEVINN